MFHGGEVFVSGVLRFSKEFNINKKMGQQRKSHQAKTIQRPCSVRMRASVLIAQNILSPQAHPFVCVHMQEAAIENIFIHV